MNRVIKNFLINKYLKKNKIFKNMYLGQTCYVFGNGVSLKKYDLKNFTNYKSIICGWLYLHNQISKLDVAAEVYIHPYIFYTFWKNNYLKKYQLNKLLRFMKYSKRMHLYHPFFTSLANMPPLIFNKKVYYLHHFGLRKPNINFLDISNSFSFMQDSVMSSLGIAHYMGFKKIYLVGMDYFSNVGGHFYEYGRGWHWLPEMHDAKIDALKQLKNKIEILLITPNDYSNNNIFKNINYQKLTDDKEIYKENNEIIKPQYLDYLNNLDMQYKIYK